MESDEKKLYCYDCKSPIEDEGYVVKGDSIYHVDCWLAIKRFEDCLKIDEEE